MQIDRIAKQSREAKCSDHDIPLLTNNLMLFDPFWSVLSRTFGGPKQALRESNTLRAKGE